MSAALTALAVILWAAGWAAVIAAVAMHLRGHRDVARWFLALADWPIGAGDAAFTVASALRHQWLLAGWFAALTALVIWSHRRNRRKRKRARALLGAKSRQLRDALVRKQRELTRPRPVLRPVPQAGGW